MILSQNFVQKSKAQELQLKCTVAGLFQQLERSRYGGRRLPRGFRITGIPSHVAPFSRSEPQELEKSTLNAY